MYQPSIPVLFITFARPDYARQTFEGIKKAKPSILYFYSNKARVDKPDEINRNNAIRAFVDEIDWNCDLRTFFREDYVDIYTSLWSAIDWIFENEEQAIILEEDCVPSLAFFDFCAKLLPRYKDDLRVWVISGNNFFEGYNPNGYDYIFSRHPYKYGWASWKDRWDKVHRDKIPWEEIKNYDLHRQQYSLTKKKSNFYIKKQEKNFMFLKSKPAWDYFFDFTVMMEGGVGIIPVTNLVTNIGCQGEHSKVKESMFHNNARSKQSEYLIINHPKFIIPDFKYDQLFFKTFFNNWRLSSRLLKKLKSILNNLVKRQLL